MSGNGDVVWYLRLQEEDLGSVLVLTAHGRVFSATVADLSSRLASVDLRRHRALILDFSGVDYINSEGLRIVETAAARRQASAGHLIVCGLQSSVKTAFDLAGSAARLIIEPTREAAIHRLGL